LSTEKNLPFFRKKRTLIFDTWPGFGYKCAPMAERLKTGKILLAIRQALLYITPLVLA
jgi:cellobiose-specific phosphotransferase system component IIC